MRRPFTILVLLVLCASVAHARIEVATPAHEFEGPNRENTVFWFDDMEGDISQYVSVDLSAGAEPHFHWDTYLAFEGRGSSWWCGNFDYDTDGGYGNSWDDRLNVGPVDNSTATYTILTYAYRHDSEVGFDFTWVQAESLGVYRNLNRGYDGKQPWTDIGLYGFVIEAYDKPATLRFRFVSDGAWSDEDGLYLSTGGAFQCDNVKIFDYFTGYVYFYDSEPGAREDECVPDVPGAAGDWWHLIDRACPALSDPHSWWCGDDADTGLIPPNLQDALFSPVADISAYSALSCTAHFAMHFAIPTVDNDYLSMYGTCDGSNYYSFGGWWGDFGQCDGWGTTAYNRGFDVGQFCPGRAIDYGGFVWIMYTTDNGCGPGAAGDAGAMIDDLWFEGVEGGTAVEEKSWGTIKSMYGD